MPRISPGDSRRTVPLTPRLALRPGGGWSGSVEVAPPPAAVLGGAPGPNTTAPIQLFAPAEPAIDLAITLAPSAVLSDSEQPAEVEYQPEEEAVYALIHEVRTPDGSIYDITLPKPAVPHPAVLGGEATPNMLRFPVNPIVFGEAGPAAVLGIGDVVGGMVGDVVARRILQVIKSPLDRFLLDTIRQNEPAPRIVALRDTFQPLEGFEAWRALLPPGGERRVLLFIHGFGSSSAGSGGAAFLPHLSAGYDAVLGYDHPTVSRDPLENARALLALIPDDLRLTADLIAHSRGGLVARSLVELIGPAAQLTPRRLITHGTPHNGTQLADPARWDRLVSLGMTAASWLAAATGVTAWVPKVLEYVLKAAAQSIFSLPGIVAMTPGSDFLARLNASGGSAAGSGAPQHVQYAAVTSAFSAFSVKEPGFRQALFTLAAQAFIDAPNDLVVPTDSMSAIDPGSSLLAPERQLKAAINHFSYFRDEAVLSFVRQQLA